MIRLVATLVTGSAMFLAGYFAADYYVRHRAWDADLDVRNGRGRSADEPAADSPRTGDSPIRFTDIAAELGVDFSYYDGAEGEYHLMETTGGGMAVADFDANGWMDLYFVNGSRLPVSRDQGAHRSRLYRNLGPVGMDDVSVPSGTELTAYGQGAAAGDWDNDGFPDLAVTCFGRIVLFVNRGDGTFAAADRDLGIESDAWCTSAAWSDLDRDGALDLYVCTYGEASAEQPRVCERSGQRLHCLPTAYPPQPDLVFRNLGDGRFREMARAMGVHDETGRGLGVAIADFDRDADPDIFVANDTSANFLFQQQLPGEFVESALRFGVALTGGGATMSGMGVACGDFDANGWLDLSVTNFYHERSVLYQNFGPQGFSDTADATGIGLFSRDRLGFGTIFLDADLDTRLDLFVANGHVSDMTKFGLPYKMRAQLLANRLGKRFDDVSDSSGAYFQQRWLGRGVAGADVNNDGLPDVVVSHIGDSAAVLLNQTSPHGHWLGLRLVGTSSNRDGTNATVRLMCGGREQYHERFGGGGYLSSSDPRLVAGLGGCDRVDDVEVRWPSGRVQRLDAPEIDRYHWVVEGGD